MDPRLNFTHLTNDTNTEKNILVEPPEQVWIPDVFMDNSKHASFHMVTKKNEMLRLWPNGSLFYSVRYVTDFNCVQEPYSEIQNTNVSLLTQLTPTKNSLAQAAVHKLGGNMSLNPARANEFFLGVSSVRNKKFNFNCFSIQNSFALSETLIV